MAQQQTSSFSPIKAEPATMDVSPKSKPSTLANPSLSSMSASASPPASDSSTAAKRDKGSAVAPSQHPRKRSKVSRACDECRRKKIRCDASPEEGKIQCSSCKRSGDKCSFCRVPLKRGPSKGQRRDTSSGLTKPSKLSPSVKPKQASDADVPDIKTDLSDQLDHDHSARLSINDKSTNFRKRSFSITCAALAHNSVPVDSPAPNHHQSSSASSHRNSIAIATATATATATAPTTATATATASNTPPITSNPASHPVKILPHISESSPDQANNTPGNDKLPSINSFFPPTFRSSPKAPASHSATAPLLLPRISTLGSRTYHYNTPTSPNSRKSKFSSVSGSSYPNQNEIRLPELFSQPSSTSNNNNSNSNSNNDSNHTQQFGGNPTTAQHSTAPRLPSGASSDSPHHHHLPSQTQGLEPHNHYQTPTSHAHNPHSTALDGTGSSGNTTDLNLLSSQADLQRPTKIRKTTSDNVHDALQPHVVTTTEQLVLGCWNDQSIDTYYQVIHPTLPILPSSKVKLKAWLLACPNGTLATALLSGIVCIAAKLSTTGLEQDSANATTNIDTKEETVSACKNQVLRAVLQTTMASGGVSSSLEDSDTSNNTSRTVFLVLHILLFLFTNDTMWLGSAVSMAYNMNLHKISQIDAAPSKSTTPASTLSSFSSFGRRKQVCTEETVQTQGRRLFLVLTILDCLNNASTHQPALFPDQLVHIDEKRDAQCFGSRAGVDIIKMCLIFRHTAKVRDIFPQSQSQSSSFSLSPKVDDSLEALFNEMEDVKLEIEGLWDTTPILKAMYYCVEVSVLAAEFFLAASGASSSSTSKDHVPENINNKHFANATHMLETLSDLMTLMVSPLIAASPLVSHFYRLVADNLCNMAAILEPSSGSSPSSVTSSPSISGVPDGITQLAFSIQHWDSKDTKQHSSSPTYVASSFAYTHEGMSMLRTTTFKLLDKLLSISSPDQQQPQSPRSTAPVPSSSNCLIKGHPTVILRIQKARSSLYSLLVRQPSLASVSSALASSNGRSSFSGSIDAGNGHSPAAAAASHSNGGVVRNNSIISILQNSQFHQYRSPSFNGRSPSPRSVLLSPPLHTPNPPQSSSSEKLRTPPATSNYNSMRSASIVSGSTVLSGVSQGAHNTGSGSSSPATTPTSSISGMSGATHLGEGSSSSSNGYSGSSSNSIMKRHSALDSLASVAAEKVQVFL